MTYCQTVLVKFMNQSLPQQEVRAKQLDGADELQVVRDYHYVIVKYMSSSGLCLKEINYNRADIREYVLEGISNIERPEILPKKISIGTIDSRGV